MDTRALDMLHDAGDKDILAVADGVHLKLLAHDVAIYQHGLVDVDLDRRLQVVAQTLLVRDDLHGAAAQHVARAHQHRVADAGGGLHTDSISVTASASGWGMPSSSMIFSKQPRSSAFRIASTPVPMMGTPSSGERLSEVDRGLSAERHDDGLSVFRA